MQPLCEPVDMTKLDGGLIMLPHYVPLLAPWTIRVQQVRQVLFIHDDNILVDEHSVRQIKAVLLPPVAEYDLCGGIEGEFLVDRIGR
jgi:hypothetical protein